MYPLQFLNSLNWKLTLPVGGAQEIKQPDLATYTSEWFHLNEAGDGVVFKVPSSGDTTANSKNPRSELREMLADGRANAAWSTTNGTHSMMAELSVDVLPYPKKPHVVTGQIHDASDDVTVFRVEGNADGKTATIWITNGNTTHDTGSTPGYKLTDSYVIGTKYRIGFVVYNGVISYMFNDKVVIYTQAKSKSGCYFKLGAYNQDGGDTTPGVYAQVTLYAYQVCHDGKCVGNWPTTTTPAPIDPPTPPPATDDLMTELLARVEVLENLVKAIKTAFGAL